MKRWILLFAALLFTCLFYGNTLAETVQLPQTGQTVCYNSSGTVIPCAGTGQDGDIRAGVAWPSPRFTDNNNGTMTDNLTGLIWLKQANLCNAKNWQTALTKIADFNANPASFSIPGLTDTSGGWRLPNINELESLMNSNVTSNTSWLTSQGFTSVKTSYWSSTSHAYWQANGSSVAWLMSFDLGFVGNNTKTYAYYIWPVKGPVGNPPAKVWKTGQTVSYATGDDGDYEIGTAWPDPRFVDNEDGTITDNLTGLMWFEDTNCIGTMNWTNALSAIITLNNTCSVCAAGHSDWRLPNIKELYSLTDYSNYNPALPASHPFLNFAYQHSSTTHLNYKTNYRDTYLAGNGGTTSTNKVASVSVWSVRTVTHSLSVIFNPTNAGYVTVDDEECVSSPCKITRHNQEVTLEAFPECGYEFDHWEWNDGANASTENPMDFTVGDDEVVTAVFNWNIKLPLPGGKNWRLNVEMGGDTDCSIQGPDQYHIGNGYYSLDFDDLRLGDDQEIIQEYNVPIYAAASGIIDSYGYDSDGYGYWVKINHQNEYETLYAHMVSQSLITSGPVNQGAQLGVVGTSGNSTGTHLHFQIYYGGSSTSTVTELALVEMENLLLSNYTVGCHAYYTSSNTQ